MVKISEHLQNLYNLAIDPRVSELLDQTRFRWFLKLGDVNHCLPLLEALVAAYDAKKRVFVFRGGITLCFTLEDVLFITGLPVNGDVVSGKTFKDSNTKCINMFGVAPKKENSGVVNLKYMREMLPTLQVDADGDSIRKNAQAMLFQILGCTILATKQGNELNTKFVPLMDLDSIDTYAWGAAYLAHLHVALERAQKSSSAVPLLESSTFPLMVFIFERIPKLANVLLSEEGSRPPKQFPLMVSWSNELKRPLNSNYRKDSMEYHRILHNELVDADVIWQPYQNLTRDFIPSFIPREELLLGRARVPLISFEHARYQRPDLCLLQFEVTGISVLPPLIKLNSKGYNSSGERGIDYRLYKKLPDCIAEWGMRFQRLVGDGDLAEDARGMDDADAASAPQATQAIIIYTPPPVLRGHMELHSSITSQVHPFVSANATHGADNFPDMDDADAAMDDADAPQAVIIHTPPPVRRVMSRIPKTNRRYGSHKLLKRIRDKRARR